VAATSKRFANPRGFSIGPAVLSLPNSKP
jgi:hypothetical protein